MRKVVFDVEVRHDLAEIGDYIAQDNPRRAASFLRELRFKALSLGRSALHYARVPELADDIRIAFYGAYAIIYRVHPDRIQVIRIAHASRQLSRLFRT